PSPSIPPVPGDCTSGACKGDALVRTLRNLDGRPEHCGVSCIGAARAPRRQCGRAGRARSAVSSCFLSCGRVWSVTEWPSLGGSEILADGNRAEAVDARADVPVSGGSRTPTSVVARALFGGCCPRPGGKTTQPENSHSSIVFQG